MQRDLTADTVVFGSQEELDGNVFLDIALDVDANSEDLVVEAWSLYQHTLGVVC